MGKRWVYVKTEEPVVRHGIERQQAPSVRAEVIGLPVTTYRVRMPDGEEREVTDADLQFQRREPDPIEQSQRYGNRVCDEHPGQGMIGIYHTSGLRRIFGSKIESHQHFVTIRIVRGASVEHDLGQDWYYGGGDHVIEVALSPARFAEFMATPNRGDGVPCSITYHSPVPGPGSVPQPASQETEVRKIVDSIHDLGAKLRRDQAQAREALEAVLAKIPKSRREEALALFDQSARAVTSSAPFLVSSAVEALEHRVTESKAEVEAFVATAIRSAGVEAIREDPSKLQTHGQLKIGTGEN